MAQGDPQLPEIPGYDVRYGGASAIPNVDPFVSAGSNPLAASFAAFSTQLAGAMQDAEKQDIEKQVAEGKAWRLESQKTFKQAVKDGDIHPTQNPWFVASAMETDGELNASSLVSDIQGEWDKITSDENDPRGRDPHGFEDFFNAKLDEFTDNNYVDSHYWKNSFLDRVVSDRDRLTPAAEAAARDRQYVYETDRKIDAMTTAAVAGDLETLQNALDAADAAGHNDRDFRKRLIASVFKAALNSEEPERVYGTLRELRTGPQEQGAKRPRFTDSPEFQAEYLRDEEDIKSHIVESITNRNRTSLLRADALSNATTLRRQVFSGLALEPGTEGHIPLGEGVAFVQDKLNQSREQLRKLADKDGKINGVPLEETEMFQIHEARIMQVQEGLLGDIREEEQRMRILRGGSEAVQAEIASLLSAGAEGLGSGLVAAGSGLFEARQATVDRLANLTNPMGKSVMSRTDAENLFDRHMFDIAMSMGSPDERNKVLVHLAQSTTDASHKNLAASRYVQSRLFNAQKAMTMIQEGAPLGEASPPFQVTQELQDAVSLMLAYDRAGMGDTLSLHSWQKQFLEDVKHSNGGNQTSDEATLQNAITTAFSKVGAYEPPTLSRSAASQKEVEAFLNNYDIEGTNPHRQVMRDALDNEAATLMAKEGFDPEVAMEEARKTIESLAENGDYMLSQRHNIMTPLAKGSSDATTEEIITQLETDIIARSRADYEEAYNAFDDEYLIPQGTDVPRFGDITLLQKVREAVGDAPVITADDDLFIGDDPGAVQGEVDQSERRAPIKQEKNKHRDLAWYRKNKPEEYRAVVDELGLIEQPTDFPVEIKDRRDIFITAIPTTNGDSPHIQVMIRIPNRNPNRDFPEYIIHSQYTRNEVAELAERTSSLKKSRFYAGDPEAADTRASRGSTLSQPIQEEATVPLRPASPTTPEGRRGTDWLQSLGE